MAAVDAGAGPDVEHVVGGADGVLVVLDHDHGIAEIAQPLERFQQPRIVALVQPDRRLVEHVEHAGEPRADLRGEPDALALAAGERARGARQREIFEPDVDQEFEPVADFLEHPHRDLVLLGAELAGQFGEPFAGALDRHLGDLADMQAADLHAQRLGLEPDSRLQAAQGMSVKYFAISSRAQSLSVSRQRRSRLVTTPSNGFVV